MSAYGYPDNVMEVIGNAASLLDGVTNVVHRSLNPTDPHGTLGMDAEEWVPDEQEIGPLGFEPSLSHYLITLQHVIKHESAETGAVLHRETAKKLRTMLYRDADLNVALRQLKEVEGNRSERMLNWQVIGQRFASNEINGAFVSMSVTEFSFTTETSNL